MRLDNLTPMAVRAGLSLATTLVLVSGCTAHDPVDPDPDTPTSPSPSVQPNLVEPPTGDSSSPPARETTAGEYDLVNAPMEWFTAAGPSEELRTVYALAEDMMVVTAADLSGDRVVALGPESRHEYAVPAGQIVQNAFVVAGDVVIVTAAADVDDFWITRWDPATGTAQTMYEATGDDGWYSEAAIFGTDLYMNVRGDADTECVVRLDLHDPKPALKASTVACAEPGKRVGWVKITEGSLTFLAASRETTCPTLYQVDLPEGAPEQLDVDGCVSRGIAHADWIVWTEPPPVDAEGYENYFDADLRVQVGGERRDLGAAVTGSTTICDGALYWTWEDMEAPLEPSQIRRWTPSEGVQIVYESPDGGNLDRYATGAAQCYDGVVTFQRFGWWGSAGQELMASVPLGWAPNLNGAEAASPSPAAS